MVLWCWNMESNISTKNGDYWRLSDEQIHECRYLFFNLFFPDINFIVQFNHDGHAYYWDVYVHEYPFWIMDFGFVHSQAIVIECLIGYCPGLFPMRCSISWNKTQTQIIIHLMMTSSNGNIFRVTGPLCGEFTGHRWISRTKAIYAELWCFLWSAPE